MTRSSWLFGLVACGLVACATEVPDPSPAQPVEDLRGNAHAMAVTRADGDAAARSVDATVDGAPLTLRFGGATLRLQLGQRSLELRSVDAAKVHVTYDDAEHGEVADFDVPRVSRGAADALASVRGRVGRRELDRYDLLVPVAERVVSSWSDADGAVASQLLASWIDAWDRGASTPGGVAPRFFDDGMPMIEDTCSEGTSCSISNNGYSCSVSCRQGGFPFYTQNCASCFRTIYGGVSCGCQW